MRTFALFVLVACEFTGAQTPVAKQDRQVTDARAISVTGEVSTFRNGQPWALNAGDGVPAGQVISSGADGYADFRVAGGSSFEIFSNSRVVFRDNAADSGDLLNVISGRVRIHLRPGIGQLQQRVFCPVASIVARTRTTLALAVDEDETARIDVIEGSVRVQHALLPQKAPVLVTAVDAILVERDERISRRLERGSLYRYTVGSIRDVLWVIMLGHSGTRGGEAEFEGERLLAKASSLPFLPRSGP